MSKFNPRIKDDHELEQDMADLNFTKMIMNDEAFEALQNKIDYVKVLHHRKGDFEVTEEQIRDKIIYNMHKWKCNEEAAIDLIIKYYTT
jgi:hypothetical protein